MAVLRNRHRLQSLLVRLFQERNRYLLYYFCSYVYWVIHMCRRMQDIPSKRPAALLLQQIMIQSSHICNVSIFTMPGHLFGLAILSFLRPIAVLLLLIPAPLPLPVYLRAVLLPLLMLSFTRSVPAYSHLFIPMISIHYSCKDLIQNKLHTRQCASRRNQVSIFL